MLSQGGLEPQERLTPTPLHHTHARAHTHPLSLIFSFSLPLRIVLMDDAMDCLMSFSDFLFAFQIQFYYSGESLPGPRGSCGTTVPDSRPALWPLRLLLWPALSAPPPFMAGFPAGCAVLAGGHKTRPAGPTHSASSRHGKPRCFPPAGGHTSV